ncbi:hypothetical protein E2C01_049436 [Portunus trituberculatus]|uniref:Uncharacterized protein n=1 Tax=Portunus trituberculatus TaxID=210409 RepID=A0A5B7GEF1_PORTR|nr:hypothetical protein [Portunus trituberculatus]
MSFLQQLGSQGQRHHQKPRTFVHCCILPAPLQHAILYTQHLPLLQQGLDGRTFWRQFLLARLLTLLHQPQHRSNVRISMLSVFPPLAGLTRFVFHSYPLAANFLSSRAVRAPRLTWPATHSVHIAVARRSSRPHLRPSHLRSCAPLPGIHGLSQWRLQSHLPSRLGSAAPASRPRHMNSSQGSPPVQQHFQGSAVPIVLIPASASFRGPHMLHSEPRNPAPADRVPPCRPRILVLAAPVSTTRGHGRPSTAPDTLTASTVASLRHFTQMGPGDDLAGQWPKLPAHFRFIPTIMMSFSCGQVARRCPHRP